nr:triacylglycerol lipase 2 [Tanacetum cinerariifolium]
MSFLYKMATVINCVLSKQKMTYTISTVIITFIYLITISRAVRTLNSIKDESFLVLGDQVGICSLLIQPEGYTCEEHEVTTKDGYILSMQRIPAARGGTKADKPPVLLQHGLLM